MRSSKLRKYLELILYLARRFKRRSSNESPRMETFLIIALIVIGGIGIVAATAYANKKRREDLERQRATLLAKYHDSQIVDMIMRHMFWQGQSQEQLLDSLGRPADIDQKVMKTKVKEIWKYNQTGESLLNLKNQQSQPLNLGALLMALFHLENNTLPFQLYS